MDPWPQQRKEPKAPDKNIEALNNKDSNIIMKIKSDSSFSSCGKTDNYSPRVLPSNKESSISSLNEPDLKALLEEAMAYKRPKDIQGKSDLFKELLHSVEAEKKLTALSRPEKPNNRKLRRKQMNKKEVEKTSHEGPFQDLIVHVSGDSDGSTKRPVKYSLKSPSTVPQVVPVSTVSVCDENNPEIAALLQNGTFDSIEQLQQFIAKEANVYQIKEPVDARVGFPLTISPYEKKPDDFGQSGIKSAASPTSPPKESPDTSLVSKECVSDSKTKSIDENGNSVGTSKVDSLAERKAKARRLKAKNDKNTILSQHIEGHRSDIAEDIDALIKYIESPKIDESKSRQRNVMSLAKTGSRATNKIGRVRDKSSDTFSGKIQKSKGNKLQKSSSLEEVSISKFEDLTISKEYTDLSSEKKQHPIEEKEFKNSTEGVIDCLKIMSPRKERPFQRDKLETELLDADFLPVTKKSRKKKNCESHIRNKITKMNVGFRGEKVYINKTQDLEGFTVSSREFQRRKSISSVPSSDKSGDTSDMDSVHSFPVSSNKGRAIKNNVSASVGSTPQISYADMARSVPSPSKIQNDAPATSKMGADCSFVSDENIQQTAVVDNIPTVVVQLPTKKHLGSSVHNLKEEYPPLHVDICDKTYSSKDMFVEYTVVVPKRSSSVAESNCINVAETVLIDMPPTKGDAPVVEGLSLALDDKLPTKRPPVILMNSNANDCNDVNDLVFGFEVNEQLLCSSSAEILKSSDIVCNNNVDNRICETKISVDQNIQNVINSSNNDVTTIIWNDDRSDDELEYNHEEIVDFISKEWDLVKKELESPTEDQNDKVQYFSP